MTTVPKKIWCLFSVDNLYDQPPCNLVAWWSFKPPASLIREKIEDDHHPLQEEEVRWSAKIRDGVVVRIRESDYRLEEVSEGADPLDRYLYSFPVNITKTGERKPCGS